MQPVAVLLHVALPLVHCAAVRQGLVSRGPRSLERQGTPAIVAQGHSVSLAGDLAETGQDNTSEASNLSNRSHLGNSSQPALSRSQYGDLACMRWTGGTCHIFGCRSIRGPVECIGGLCLCSSDYCADSTGSCSVRAGKWLGRFAIRFEHPADEGRPYMGVSDDLLAWWGEDYAAATSHGIKRVLASTEDASPQWDIALTGGGHVRFESAKVPGHAITIWSSRRRRRSEDAPFRLPDWNHHGKWPALMEFESASPLDLTFQVARIELDGGGLQIWDPQTGKVLASARAGGFFSSELDKGVSYCTGNRIFGACRGRQLVTFDPALPAEATPALPQEYIHSVFPLSWWQVVLLAGLFAVLFFGAWRLYQLCRA